MFSPLPQVVTAR